MKNSIIEKLKNTGISVILILALIIPPSAIIAQESVQQNQFKFGRLLRLVNSFYVDSVNIDKLTEDAIVHVLSELDPHSSYLSKDEVEKANEKLKGNFEGVGISFNIFKDTLLVTTTISGGPSEKVGVRAGDRIVEVDNKNIAGIGLKNSDVFDLLRGDKGTRVDIKVLRRKVPELLDFTIIRDKIPIYSLDASYMLDENTGYIKLNQFTATTVDEFSEALKDLKHDNMKNLVLDLRGNPGGYLNAAVEISDQFLKNNDLIVYTEGLNDAKREYSATSNGDFEEGNLVVLVDENSASASEIVSGAVQDWDRGIIIGRRSFGKGLVQKQYFLTDGSMIRLTTAHYFTPSGRCIQKPYDEGIDNYRQDYQKRFTHGELFSADSIVFADSLRYKTLLNGRDVFGGGGVMPDIFVPLDTSSNYRYINRLRRNSIIFDYAMDYIDKHREEIKKNYPEFDMFNKEFEVSDEIINEVVASGEKNDIEKDDEGLAFSKNDIKTEIKAIIARDIFSRNDFYRIYYKDDEAIKEALKVIKNQKEYNNLLVSTVE